VFSGMLGVTLFGIFLTPVFFYVIAGFADNPLFSTQRMRQVGLVLRYGLGILALGLPWWLRGRLRPEIRPKVALAAVQPGANGHANGTPAPETPAQNGTPTNGVPAPTSNGEPKANGDLVPAEGVPSDK
jgi:hypothetical protein